MAKRQEVKEEVKQKRIYTSAELDEVYKEVGGIFSKQSRIDWLKSKGAIKTDQFNDIIVLQKPDGSIPYTELSELFEEASQREIKKEYARRMQGEGLEEVASQEVERQKEELHLQFTANVI